MKYLRNEEGIKNFGKKVKELRLLKEFSQEELAFDAGLEYSQISRIERGIINTSISQIFAIAKALNIEPFELFKFEK